MTPPSVLKETFPMGESRDFPRCVFHCSGKIVTVKNPEEEAALGGGWARHPADFIPYQGPRRVEAGHDPCRWVDVWRVEGLSESDRPKIKAELLRAHAVFWKAPDALHADAQAMSLAFHGVARILSDAGILNKQHLEEDIPELVWDAAIAGAWWRFASETHQGMFPTKQGHYWVYRDDGRDWNHLFVLEAIEWHARLLEAPAHVTDPTEPLKSRDARPPAQRWEDVCITFLSEERVQIWIANQPETCNYAEIGFADRRSGKPDKSSAVVRFLAQNGGLVPTTGRAGKDWAALEKQIERTKKVLKNYFGISDDPLPFEKGVGYQLRCKIECAPWFDK
jgi:hypothetical protein